MDSLIPSLKELERWYGIFRKDLFGGRLPKNKVVTIQSRDPRARKRSNSPGLLGWHACDRWSSGSGKLHEVNVVAETLGDSAETILHTLLHELCHHWNVGKGIQDVSPGSQYHNANFKATAERAGLVCNYADRVGWGSTELGPRALAIIRRHKPVRSAFSLVRLEPTIAEKKPSKHKKWICLCGPIRVGRAEFHAQCLVCDSEFEKVEE